jgi:hypothetical protein
MAIQRASSARMRISLTRPRLLGDRAHQPLREVGRHRPALLQDAAQVARVQAQTRRDHVQFHAVASELGAAVGGGR